MTTDTTTPIETGTDPAAEIRPPAEIRYVGELATLDTWDIERGHERPPGWRLSPRAVRAFIVGSEELGVSRKFYGDDPLVDRAVVSLMGRQGLMLVGEPGTAKSMLSELLSAAVSGTSTLTVQGTAGTTEDHVRYSWNYALLVSEGPSERSLVPSPVCTGMREGRVVRFEEITRCAPEIQDTLVSILSEKQLMVPELGPDARVAARPGFTVIATANLKDRGVHEMSAASSAGSASRRWPRCATARSRSSWCSASWRPSSGRTATVPRCRATCSRCWSPCSRTCGRAALAEGRP